MLRAFRKQMLYRYQSWQPTLPRRRTEMKRFFYGRDWSRWRGTLPVSGKRHTTKTGKGWPYFESLTVPLACLGRGKGSSFLFLFFHIFLSFLPIKQQSNGIQPDSSGGSKGIRFITRPPIPRVPHVDRPMFCFISEIQVTLRKPLQLL